MDSENTKDLSCKFDYEPKGWDLGHFKLDPVDLFGTKLEAGQSVNYLRETVRGPVVEPGKLLAVSYATGAVVLEWGFEERKIVTVGKYTPVLHPSGTGEARFAQIQIVSE